MTEEIKVLCRLVVRRRRKSISSGVYRAAFFEASSRCTVTSACRSFPLVTGERAASGRARSSIADARRRYFSCRAAVSAGSFRARALRWSRRRPDPTSLEGSTLEHASERASGNPGHAGNRTSSAITAFVARALVVRRVSPSLSNSPSRSGERAVRTRVRRVVSRGNEGTARPTGALERARVAYSPLRPKLLKPSVEARGPAARPYSYGVRVSGDLRRAYRRE